jgi:integrase
VARRAELPELVRVFLGTGLRIGEGLAVRRLDVNLEGVPVDGGTSVPVVAVTENLVWVKDKGLVRHEGKSDAALRLIPLPAFAVDVIRSRLAVPGDPSARAVEEVATWPGTTGLPGGPRAAFARYRPSDGLGGPGG